MNRAAIYTLGCRLNSAESALITDSAVSAGYEVVMFHDEADLGIINTCTVTGEADAKCRKAIRGFIRRNPSAFVAVIGCYSQLAAESIARIPGVDLVIGNKDKLRVMEFVRQKKNATPTVICGPAGNGDFKIETHGRLLPISRRVNLKIQEGCNVLCSYCIVPMARGGPRSRDYDDLREEARRLVERGVKELVLTGVNVGAYDYQGRGLLDVVDALNEIEGLARIRISSIELPTVPEELLDRMADVNHKLVPFLHVPLQSGSERILSLMRRKYTAEEFRRFIEKAAGIVSDLCVGTDIMVGFPGETQADFDDTAALLAKSPIAYAHVFKYSDRTGAPAAKMAGKLDPKLIHARSEEIRCVSDEKWERYCRNYIGRHMPVLFEDQEDGRWCGYTGNYIRVAVCSDANLENQIQDVKLDEVSGEVMTGSVK